MNEINTSDTLADGVDVTPADGGENDSQTLEQALTSDSSDVMEVKDLLSDYLKRPFDDNESALKAVKDTFDFVGKAGKYKPLIEKLEASKGGEKNVLKLMEELTQGEVQATPQAAPDLTPELASKLQALEKQVQESSFYAENPEYKEHKGIIAAMGSNPADVVKSDVFQKAFSAINAQREMESSKSVLHTNPRLGQAKDKISEARELADKSAVITDSVKDAAAQAVMDAYNL